MDVDYGLRVADRQAVSARIIFQRQKVANGNISLIVPEAVGKCSILPVPAEALREWMQAGGIV